MPAIFCRGAFEAAVDGTALDGSGADQRTEFAQDADNSMEKLGAQIHITLVHNRR